ncbi:MAG: hypothetical protein OEW05_07970 [Candidatus Aminicenantes bacterium]|nr:hypothetical protein [Candidatus Aminicenantes bacterium]
MDPQEDIRRTQRSVLAVAITILSSLLVFLALGEVIRARFKPFTGFHQAGGDPQTLRYVVYGIAVVVVILIRVLRQALLRRRPEDSRLTLLHRLNRASLVTLVLGEVPALLGLMLFLYRGLNRDFYALIFVSLILIFMYFPRLASWNEWLKG